MVGVLFLGTGAGADAQTFHVKGTLSSEYNETVGVSRKRLQFEVAVNQDRWHIQVKDESNPSIDSFVAYNDSTNIFQVIKLRDAEPGSNVASLDIWSSAVPVPPAGFVSYLWQAFCSGSYYATNATGLVDPVAYVTSNFRHQRLKLHGQWKLAAGPVKFPVTVTETFRETVLIEEDLGKVKSYMLPQSIKQVTNSVYQVVAWSDPRPFKLPIEFRFTRYAIDKENFSTRELHHINGVVSEFGFEPQEIKETVASMTMVYDHRVDMFGKPSAFGYMATDGRILPLEQVYTNEQFVRMEAMPTPVPAVEKTQRTRVFRAILFITLCIPIMALVVFFVRRSGVTSKEA